MLDTVNVIDVPALIYNSQDENNKCSNVKIIFYTGNLS
jgi:hypothetical protein